MHMHIYICIARELRRTSLLCLSVGYVVEKKIRNNCALVCALENKTTTTIYNDNDDGDDESTCDCHIQDIK